MSIKDILQKLYKRIRKNRFVKELAYFYFLLRDQSYDTELKLFSKRKQKLVKKYIYRFILKMDQMDTYKEKVSSFKYRNLGYILELSKRIDKGDKYYIKAKQSVDRMSCRLIRHKDKIIVGFMANYSSSWIGDELYQLFDQSKQFEPYVFLLANHNGQNQEMMSQEYQRNLLFFEERGVKIVETYDVNTRKSKNWNEIKVNPDICIWLTSWLDLFEKKYQIERYAINTLHTYIPYGFMVADDLNHSFVCHQYNHRIHNMVWKNFEESIMSVEMAKKYSYVKGVNAVFTGYPKMDMFYSQTVSDFWKPIIEKSGNSNAKRIIYAPHHTVDEGDAVYFSTFAYNYRAILELAKKYNEQTVWIFKPHPHLKYKAIKYGIFKDEVEWEQYENEWRTLKNADVVNDGMYYDMFAHSDGMILDSVSFLAEYLYVNKPLLFLTSQGQRFNDFGNQLINVHYSVAGENVIGIEEFLSKVILEQQDENKDKRAHFFSEYLDYRTVLGKSAAENILTHIKHEMNEVY